MACNIEYFLTILGRKHLSPETEVASHMTTLSVNIQVVRKQKLDINRKMIFEYQ